MKRAESVTRSGGSILQPATRLSFVDNPGLLRIILPNADNAPCHVAQMVVVPMLQAGVDLVGRSRGAGCHAATGAG